MSGISTQGGRVRSAILGISTALAIVGGSLGVLLTPIYTHAALDASGSTDWLQTSSAEVHSLSDRTIAEMLRGPGTFDFGWSRAARFFDPAEAAHLRDARTLLIAFGVIAIAGLLLVIVTLARRRRAHDWRAVGAGAATLAVALTVIGVLFLVAFDTAFETFHRLFFPGGNWAFDVSRERLVQLYPTPFWQLTSAALAILAVGASVAVWLLARRRSRRPAAS